MSGYGLMEDMRDVFADQLRVFKGGATGVAEIRRQTGPSTNYSWPASNPAETIAVHYEQTDSHDGSVFDLSVGGTPGFTVYLDGALDTPLVNGDRLIIEARNLTLKVEREAKRGNNTAGDAVDCVVIHYAV